jgi:acetyl esterase/lipase
MVVEKDIAYRPYGERGMLNIVVPEGEGPFPVALCVHGGGWGGGEKNGMLPFGYWLAEVGIATVLPNYRLTGTDIHPAQIEDIFAALDWIADHAGIYSLDPSRIGVTGSSAGAHLCALAGLRAGSHSDRYTVRCMYLLSGVYDVAVWADEVPEFAYASDALLGGTTAEMKDAARDASPMTYVHPEAPACFAIHGEEDDVVPPGESVRFVEALNGVGVEAEALIIPGVGHDTWQHGSDPLEPVGGLKRYQDFFALHLG